MNYTEFSIESLEDECRKWAKDIKTEFKPDLVIYVAKAGYLVVRAMMPVFNVPLIGIDATRKGNGLKSLVGPLVSHFPKFVRNILISIELKSEVHSKNTERTIAFHSSIHTISRTNINKILIVDDSVDTGYSMKGIVDITKQYFPSADIRIAGLNVWDKSRELITTDYMLYTNTVIKAPMSKDSKQYSKFIQIYKAETKDGLI